MEQTFQNSSWSTDGPLGHEIVRDFSNYCKQMCKWKELPNIHAFFYLSSKHCLCSSSFPSHILLGMKPEPKYIPILLILLMSPTILSSAFNCSFCPINLFFPSSNFLFKLLNPHTYFHHPPLITCFFLPHRPLT